MVNSEEIKISENHGIIEKKEMFNLESKNFDVKYLKSLCSVTGN